MSKFASALSAIHEANSNNNNFSQGAKMKFLKIKDGETVTLRFINGFQETIAFSCANPQCTMHNGEMLREEYEEYASAGKPIVCPVCGQPIPATHIGEVRPAIIPANLHMGERIVTSDGKQQWRSFLCLSNSPEQMDAAGRPLYHCPICAEKKADGKNKFPSMRLTALAVVRRKKTEEVVNPSTGQRMIKVVGVEDNMITDDNGDEVPEIVVVQMGTKNFFGPLLSYDETYPIYNFDFDISRTGADISTTYMFKAVQNVDSPEPIPYSRYADYAPDVEGFLTRIGSPEYYCKNGKPVEGFIPTEANSAPAQAQNVGGYANVTTSVNPQGYGYAPSAGAHATAATYVASQVQAQPAAQPSGEYVSFDSIASNFNSYNG